jgi:hypothetical protein
VCCDEAGQVLISIGLPGKSVRPVRYNQAPKEKLTLPDGLLQLHTQVDDLLFKAILEGRAAEDRSEGYALSRDEPALRSKQLEFRDEVRLMVVQALTETRDSSVLCDLRSRTLVPLIEMAQWPKDHAISARLILGRVAGIDEQRLAQVVDEEPPDTLLQAFRRGVP